jgi:hypothetical protein
MGNRKAKANYRRTVLRLPDLDHSKSAVLNSLTSPRSRRVYQYAIEQFTAWYCSELRLAFNRIVVVRYRMHLEARGPAANTINQQLAAVRRLAYEAADAGLLSPELAAGISRVVAIAYAVALPVYGKETVDAEKPFRAELEGGKWTVLGTFHGKGEGGTVVVQIDKTSGQIRYLDHSM